MDLVARLVAPGASTELSQQVIVENRTGGTGAVAMTEVARARPDGYTLMFTGASWPVVPLLNLNLPFSMADFAALTRLTVAPHVMVVPSQLPVRSLAEFIAEAKQQNAEVRPMTGKVLEETIRALIEAPQDVRDRVKVALQPKASDTLESAPKR
jgi:tripartite-type tricarboxylate transporter receptor subunit TctC